MKEMETAMLIKGTDGFFRRFGIKNDRTLAKLRSRGMPALMVGRVFYYNPVKVLAWMEENLKVQRPEIKVK